jgi:hypothetical protein
VKIKLQAKDIMHSDRIVDYLGLNPYCLNEGMDEDRWFEFDIDMNKYEFYSLITDALHLDRYRRFK